MHIENLSSMPPRLAAEIVMARLTDIIDEIAHAEDGAHVGVLESELLAAVLSVKLDAQLTMPGRSRIAEIVGRLAAARDADGTELNVTEARILGKALRATQNAGVA